MKPRIFIAAVIALSIHGILLSTNFHFFPDTAEINPETNVIRMSLSSSENERAETRREKADVKTEEIKRKEAFLQTEPDNINQKEQDSDQAASVSVIQEAKPLSFANQPPEYPRIGRVRGYQGTVILNVLVSQRGTVSQIRIKKSSGYWILDTAAIKAVKDWKFEPGRNKGEIVQMWVEQPIRFQLK